METSNHNADPQREFLRRLKAATPRVAVTPALLAINISVFLTMTALGVSVLGGLAGGYAMGLIMARPLAPQIRHAGNAPMRKDYDLLMRYAVARRDMIKTVADYLETNDPAHEKRITELRIQAMDALNQYQQRQKK